MFTKPNYVRAKFKVSESEEKIIWAIDQVVGEIHHLTEMTKLGGKAPSRATFDVSEENVIWIKKARLDTMSGWLSLID